MNKSIRVLTSLVLTAASATLTGCVTAKAIVGPDGTTNQLVTCSSIEHCYEKAREVCGGNYKIVNTSSETEGTNGITSTETKLLVKCNQ